MTSQVEMKRKSEEASGISNITFDLLTVLQNKLDGIAALEEYKLDCEDAGEREALAVFDELERREIDDIAKLKGLLQSRLSKEKI